MTKGTPVPVSEVIIAPSILAADFTRLGQQVSDAVAAGGDWVHIDVMDGRFVPNITMGPLIVEAVRRVTDVPLDVHLMIVEPERYIDAFASAGADHITVHYEVSPNLHRTLQQIRETGCKTGVALNPHAPASALDEVLHMIDIVNVMTVNPGFGGQTFIHETLNKISQLRQRAEQRNHTLQIEVDGGIIPGTAAKVAAAGADVLVAGTSIFGHEGGIAQGIRGLRDAWHTGSS